MPIQKITIIDFTKMPSGTFLLLDVRSSGEYAHAHIPTAISLPLFTDEERKMVGTAYKQQSREMAIKLGLVYFGPKMTEMIETVEKLVSNLKAELKNTNNNIPIVVHCWRGGMRSAGIAWLLDLYGFKVLTIIGGYKNYRNWVLQQFEKSYNFKVLSGYTGSGKTEVLKILHKKEQAVIDLEYLAKHKGSAFGNLCGDLQPTQEMFENLLASHLFKYQDKNIWIEDESQRIGNVNLPSVIFKQKISAEVCLLDISFEERLKYIITDYGRFNKEDLINAVTRIHKRLGGLETKNATNYLLEDDIYNAFSILLKYYDKLYLKGFLTNHPTESLITRIKCPTVDAVANADVILQHS